MQKNNNSPDSQGTREWLLNTLDKVKSGALSTEDALRELSVLPYEDLNFAKIDHHRNMRVGFPEVIFGRGKTVEQITIIAEHMAARSNKVLVTRASPEAFKAVREKILDAVYNPASRTIVVNRQQKTVLKPGVAVITGGTSDIPVAEEAAVTAELMGNKVDKLPQIRQAKVLIVVAGMEGALPSVVGGLVSAPIIAVPTSVGYGASFNGIAALLTMLNSCAPGVSVVNIDNGFGAGYIAGLINLGKTGNNGGENEH